MAARDVVVEAFTELAPSYEGTMERELQQFWGLSYSDLIARLVDTAPIAAGAVVLDVATGTARIPITMAERVAQGLTVGLDITPAMLRRGLAEIQARGLNSRIGLVCASAMEMPFADGFFDIVICGLGMHHMDVPRALSETQRVLKRGGRLVLADVGAPSFWRSLLASILLAIGALLYRLTHRSARARAEVAAVPNLHTEAEWRAILLNLGFSDIEIIDRFPGRRLWYPSALTLRAARSAASIPVCPHSQERKIMHGNYPGTAARRQEGRDLAEVLRLH